MAALTFSTIYNEVADVRFSRDANKITQIKRWVNAAELELWNKADWVFKRVPAASLAIVAGNRLPAMPADYGKTRSLIDNNGEPLNYMDPQEFDDAYAADTSSGPPSDFTVVNRQIYVGPTPSASVTFKHGYRRRYAHLDNASAVVAGVMSVDTDKPIWDIEHHFVLVPLAIVIGARMENDPAPQVYKDAADELIEAMRSDLFGGVEAQTIQYG
jgi:hypothetical protein